MTRLACLEVPLFPLAARLRSEPDLREDPVIILQGKAHAARVVAASRRARRAGIRAGATLNQARALLPGLTIRPRDETSERAAREALFEVAESFSPRVEEEEPGILYLDIIGCQHHFDPQRPEEDLGRHLERAAARAGLPARVGIATSKLAARIAAGTPPTPRIVSAAAEAEFLAPLPLARLRPDYRLLETLQRWGITSIGGLARLPAAEVVGRLGLGGEALHARARGFDPRPLVARTPPPEFREGMALEWPLVALEPFLFIARNALERLSRRLARQGLACSRLGISLQLEPDGHHERSLALPAPTREVKTLLTLIRLELEKTPPGAPVAGFEISAHPDRPRAAQLTLFGPTEIPPDQLATTLARLFALLGEDRVGSPRPANCHRPEPFLLTPYTPPPPPRVRPEPATGRSLLGVRVLRPPVPIEVFTASAQPSAERNPTDRPVEIAPIVGDQKGVPDIQGHVRVASGPWELEEGWWHEESVQREYWDVELDRGGIYRIYREVESGEWRADGIYD